MVLFLILNGWKSSPQIRFKIKLPNLNYDPSFHQIIYFALWHTQSTLLRNFIYRILPLNVVKMFKFVFVNSWSQNSCNYKIDPNLPFFTSRGSFPTYEHFVQEKCSNLPLNYFKGPCLSLNFTKFCRYVIALNQSTSYNNRNTTWRLPLLHHHFIPMILMERKHKNSTFELIP